MNKILLIYFACISFIFCIFVSNNSYFKYDEGTSLCKSEFKNYHLFKYPEKGENLTTFKDHQPSYFLFLKIWKNVIGTDNLTLLRLPSIVFFSISAVIFFCISRLKGHGTFISIFISHLYFLNFQNLDMSSYIRELSIYLLFCMITIYIFQELVHHRDNLSRFQNIMIYFLVTSLVGGSFFYLHYALSFIAIFFFADKIYSGKKINKLLLMLLIFNFLFKTYFVFNHRFVDRPKEYFALTLSDSFSSLLKLFGYYSLSSEAWMVQVAAMFLFFLIIAECYKSRGIFSENKFEFSLILFALISFMFLRYFVNMDETSPRYFLFFTPSLLLFLGSFQNLKIQIPALAILLVLSLIDLKTSYRLNRQDNLKIVLDFFENNKINGKTITDSTDTTYCYFQSMYQLRYPEEKKLSIFKATEINLVNSRENFNVIVVDESEKGDAINAFKMQLRKLYPSLILKNEKTFKFENFNPNYFYFAQIKNH